MTSHVQVSSYIVLLTNILEDVTFNAQTSRQTVIFITNILDIVTFSVGTCRNVTITCEEVKSGKPVDLYVCSGFSDTRPRQ